jgi:hypothetical protein
MKFGESLREGLVPEWGEQYLDYKSGKQIIAKCREEQASGPGNSGSRITTDQTPLLEPIRFVEHGANLVQGMEPLLLPDPLKRSEGGSLAQCGDNSSEFTAEQAKFTSWLDQELDKVNLFYKEKEQEAYERFLLIQDQLYLLRDHKRFVVKERLRPKPITDVEKVKKKVSSVVEIPGRFIDYLNRYELPSLPSTVFLDKLKSDKNETESIAMGYDPNYIENRIRNGVDPIEESYSDEYSIDSEEEHSIHSLSPTFSPNQPTTEQDAHARSRDYTLKKQKFGIPYVVAKKQLRLAVLEHYRALTLLKSYRVLNRTAFRKITKKFDKCVHSKLTKTYVEMIDKSAYFQTSDLLEKLITLVEELFISFFDPESIDRKVSLEKLKSIAYAMNNSDMKQHEYYRSFGASLFLFGFGLPLFILTVYVALAKTFSGEMPEGRFLLQIWGGFFLIVFLSGLIGINLFVFDRCQINYKFIFEFDFASALDWKQYWLLPSLGFAVLSLLAWFSFNDFWRNQFPGRDWPWIYLCFMLGLFLWPGKQFYPKTRRWVQIILWRLLFSGFYPVEFRDFFVGDILCSISYSMGNISFFFCLYAHHWDGIFGNGPNPERNNVCGSSKSRLMGFFSSLPTIFRFLQCLRRYMDTGDYFPHLANMLKFAVSTLYYVALSVYRIDRSYLNRIIFIIIGIINSLYTTSWDLFMDWSLLQPQSKNPYLRDALFFPKKWFYYLAMAANVVLRFQWVLYACFNDQIEQLAVTSFWIAFAEVIRRFIWIFFRLENEHATNVILFRASKDFPLPYIITARVERAIKQLVCLRYTQEDESQETGDTDEDSEVVTTAYYPSLTQISKMRTQGGESDIGLARTMSRVSRASRASKARRSSRSSVDSVPKSPIRRSTLLNLSDTLNRAHIKDFQRRKTIVHQETDDEDDEEFPEISSAKVYRLRSNQYW